VVSFYKMNEQTGHVALAAGDSVHGHDSCTDDKPEQNVQQQQQQQQQQGELCGACGKSNPYIFCSRCLSVSYCSAECQKSHWREHKRSSCVKQIDSKQIDSGKGEVVSVDLESNTLRCACASETLGSEDSAAAYDIFGKLRTQNYINYSHFD
jgi:hypothetical protein